MTQTPDLRNLVYEENVRAPMWLVLTLGLFLGVAAGVVSAVAIRSLIGEPVMEGAEAAIFYVVLILYALLSLFLLVNFTNLAVTVSQEFIEFRYGIFSKKLKLSDVAEATPQKYRWSTYGGWGVRLAFGGRRAWSMIGVPMGVAVVMGDSEGGKRYFVSSRSPEALAQAINTALSTASV